jgi:hypothetical protein
VPKGNCQVFRLRIDGESPIGVQRAKRLLALTLFAAATSSNAGVYCNENVSEVIVHANANVYFKTAQTCSGNWCQANWGTSSKNAYAILLVAKTTGKRLQFYWPNLSACTQVNASLASPDSISLID